MIGIVPSQRIAELQLFSRCSNARRSDVHFELRALETSEKYWRPPCFALQSCLQELGNKKMEGREEEIVSTDTDVDT